MHNIHTLSCSTLDSSNLLTLRTKAVLVFFSLILSTFRFYCQIHSVYNLFTLKLSRSTHRPRIATYMKFIEHVLNYIYGLCTNMHFIEIYTKYYKYTILLASFNRSTVL